MERRENDIVYIVGKGSIWLDNELRYSLRSLERHIKNYRKVFIVGHLPPFINPESVVHIPVESTSKDKAINIKNKLMAVCDHPDVSPYFMFMNDDYFFMSDIDATSYPYFWKCDLTHTLEINKSLYREHVASTIRALSLKGLPLKNFDVHKPIIYSKNKLTNIVYQYDWSIRPAYVMKSIYCNTDGIEGVQRADDKQTCPMSIQRWRDKFTGVDCFSIDDKCINLHFKNFMAETFPDRSRFELF